MPSWFSGTDHHELLQLVQTVVEAAALQELTRGDEVADAGIQAGVQLLHDSLQHAEPPPLQTGLQHPLHKHLLRTVLSGRIRREVNAAFFTHFTRKSFFSGTPQKLRLSFLGTPDLIDEVR